MVERYDKKKPLNELTIIRALACLSIVMLHSIKHTVDTDVKGLFGSGLLNIAGFLSAGTPIFVLISIIVLAYSYPKSIPINFYSKRIKLILFPFISMAVFYAVALNYGGTIETIKKIIANLFGDYHAWFILLIFQFYLLYHLFIKYQHKIQPKLFILGSLIINIAYLSLFNFTDDPFQSGLTGYLWHRGFWIPFLGWIFYFALAVYIGRDYHKFINQLKKNKIWVHIALVLSGLLIIADNQLGIFENGSKRVDMIFFTTFAFFVLMFWSSKVKTIPFLIDLISRYSFGIYLMHMFYLVEINEFEDRLGIHMGYWGILIRFGVSLIGSIAVVYLLNKIYFGKYIVGNIGKSYRNTKKNNQAQVKNKNKNVSQQENMIVHKS